MLQFELYLEFLNTMYKSKLFAHFVHNSDFAYFAYFADYINVHKKHKQKNNACYTIYIFFLFSSSVINTLQVLENRSSNCVGDKFGA